MAQKVIAVFDIGKTNKKILLFDEKVNVVYQDEQIFKETVDEDGFSCDDILKVKSWLVSTLEQLCENRKFEVTAVNFATYGASLMYLDEQGQELTPVYNYLKPMPEEVLSGFYQRYGGIEEFSRATASPALGMLNSGLQALWLKRTRPQLFNKVKSVLHFPQYISYLLTGKITSEYTSIGCHTAMWNFDHMQYHKWISDEDIHLPRPAENSTCYPVNVKNREMKIGIGIHDSSASLVPYLKNSNRKFILVSSGTWFILMNPFNDEPLTADQLRKDTLCYLSVQQKQVKSSRLFLGHIHDVNVKRLSSYFNQSEDQFKKTRANEEIIHSLISGKNDSQKFFRREIPLDYIDSEIDLNVFVSFEEAYHKLVIDLTDLTIESLKLITAENDDTTEIYVSGGFARNEIFLRMFAARLNNKTLYTSEIDNSTALGAALTVWDSAFDSPIPFLDLGLKAVSPF